MNKYAFINMAFPLDFYQEYTLKMQKKFLKLYLLALKGKEGSLVSCAPGGTGTPLFSASMMVIGVTLNVTGLARHVSGFFDRGATITEG